MKEIFSRTSIRQFEDRKVEQEKVEKILRAAMQAPTAGNQQPWAFYVVKDPAVLEQLSKAGPYAGCTKQAPLAIVIGYQESEAGFPELCEIDCAIAGENIWLEAEGLGLGTVMLAIAPYKDRMAAVEAALRMSEDHHAFAIFPVGYPVKKADQPNRYDESKVFYIE